MYIDDLLIFFKYFEQHLHYLDIVFSNLRAANLKMHPSKCKFAAREAKYLGHIVAEERMRVSPENKDKVKTSKCPTYAKQVKSAPGMMGYYSRFVKNYAQIAAPHHDLL